MYLLRRTAARAISSTPSKTLFIKPRSITTYTPAFRTRQQQWITPVLNRRFVSDEATKAESAESAAATVEDFAQTAREIPIEDGLTPAQEAVQAPSTDPSATANAEALEAAALDATSGQASAESQPAESRLGGSASTPNKVVYVGNLYYEVTEDQLKRIFSRFGAVNSVKIVLDNRGLSRGFGYVEYQNTNDAQDAVDNLDMQIFEGRNLVVQFHRPRAPASRRDNSGNYVSNPPSKTLFIGNMSFEMSDKDLNELFRDIRNVMDVRVAIDRRTGQPRGFAHADFIDIASATKAKEALQGKTIYGRQLRVDFGKSVAWATCNLCMNAVLRKDERWDQPTKQPEGHFLCHEHLCYEVPLH